MPPCSENEGIAQKGEDQNCGIYLSNTKEIYVVAVFIISIL